MVRHVPKRQLGAYATVLSSAYKRDAANPPVLSSKGTHERSTTCPSRPGLRMTRVRPMKIKERQKTASPRDVTLYR